MGKLSTAKGRVEREYSPFDVYWGTDVPSNSLGVNGDIYVRYDNGSGFLFYKKESAVWKPQGAGFSGFDSSNSQLFNLTSNTSSVVVTNFTILSDSKITVERDGQKVYENYGWVRNTGTNSIDFDNAILADATSPVIVFVGKYS